MLEIENPYRQTKKPTDKFKYNFFYSKDVSYHTEKYGSVQPKHPIDV